MTAGKLSCEEAEALLPLVADSALDADSDPALFAHLARCVICQESLACHDLVALSLTRNVPCVQHCDCSVDVYPGCGRMAQCCGDWRLPDSLVFNTSMW